VILRLLVLGYSKNPVSTCEVGGDADVAEDRGDTSGSRWHDGRIRVALSAGCAIDSGLLAVYPAHHSAHGRAFRPMTGNENKRPENTPGPLNWFSPRAARIHPRAEYHANPGPFFTSTQWRSPCR